MNLALLVASEVEHVDRTHSWILPEIYELTFGIVAIVIVFGLLFWKAVPALKKGMAARTAGIQRQLDDSAQAKADAEQQASRIRQAKGDIAGERARLLAEAENQAAQLIADGRSRLEAEVADLEAKAAADTAQMASRSGDELRADIGRLASDATERLVASELDGSTQQALIESFISRVGASR